MQEEEAPWPHVAAKQPDDAWVHDSAGRVTQCCRGRKRDARGPREGAKLGEGAVTLSPLLERGKVDLLYGYERNSVRVRCSIIIESTGRAACEPHVTCQAGADEPNRLERRYAYAARPTQ